MKLPDTEALRASVQENLPPQGALRSDLVAGLTFALVNIPQGIANALLADSVSISSGLRDFIVAPEWRDDDDSDEVEDQVANEDMWP